MTEEYQVTLPKLGESIVSATIVQWFKKEGDQINLDEPLLRFLPIKSTVRYLRQSQVRSIKFWLVLTKNFKWASF